ncbi:hypothetical protein PIB30_043659, partial [Stylosanthes scabra]|nr:hypothetical protein [Stylosanthes scabra]
MKLSSKTSSSTFLACIHNLFGFCYDDLSLSFSQTQGNPELILFATPRMALITKHHFFISFSLNLSFDLFSHTHRIVTPDFLTTKVDPCVNSLGERLVSQKGNSELTLFTTPKTTLSNGAVAGELNMCARFWLFLTTLVIEHFNNSSNISQPSNFENLPSQPLSIPWGHIGTLFLCANQEGREDVLNEEDIESLHESLEEVEEGNEAQVAEDVDQKVDDNCKEPKGMEIVHSASSEVTPSKLPSELQFEWVDLPNLNFIGQCNTPKLINQVANMLDQFRSATDRQTRLPSYGELTRSVIIANPTDPQLALDNHRSYFPGGPFFPAPIYMERGRQELRVAANRASIGALDQKLSRSEIGVCGGRIDTNQFFNQLFSNSLSFDRGRE